MGTIHLFGDINNIGEEKFSLGILYIYIYNRQARASSSKSDNRDADISDFSSPQISS